MRALVTIQKIQAVEPIEESDFLEQAQVMGWSCVVKKEEFRTGDEAVYFEVDSFLPVDERYEFLRKTSYRNNEDNGEGFRIKTLRLRGQLSQGLLLPRVLFPELGEFEVGDDVTEPLGVKKWYIPETASGAGTIIGDRPSGIPASDEIRLQSALELLDQLQGRPYYITTKMDGTSCIVYCIDGKIGCCSRNHEIKDEDDALYWVPVKIYGLREKLLALGKNVVLTGELCGPGIQKNKLRLPGYAWYIFDWKDWDTQTYVPYLDMVRFCESIGVPPVPLEAAGDRFSDSLAGLLEKARGKYPSGLDKEGIVVRDSVSPHATSFKVLNNDALLKEKD
ncbi:MAG: 2'-5' RNA ligase [Clostridiales Family XIII bacterium]|jgi:RNA ligase (TIGR02306 family)|nr:2'-5' RNA ligase [Clostridiales Family XIII bacterium]